MGSWNAELGIEASSLCPKGISAKAEVGTENLSPQQKHMNDITLESHRDYMNRMLGSMSVRDAERHSGFITALYATEAFLVERARTALIKNKTDQALLEKDESPAFAELSPIYAFSIANAPEAVNT